MNRTSLKLPTCHPRTRRDRGAKRWKWTEKAQPTLEKCTRNGAVFTLNGADSSDDEPCTNRASSMGTHGLDLESLFEFDTGTLVQFAGRACGRDPDPFWNCSDTEDDRPECAEVVERLMKENEKKDKQIDVLKRTVCELLLWRSAQASFQLPFADVVDVADSQEAVSGDVVMGQMRADAPEFVSLGIHDDGTVMSAGQMQPFVPESKSDGATQANSPGHTGHLRADAPEFVSLGILSLASEPVEKPADNPPKLLAQKTKQHWPISLQSVKAEARGKATSSWKEWKSERKGDVQGVQKKLKGA